MQASIENKKSKTEKHGNEQVSNKIFTLPNLISLIRLCLIPAFFVLLTEGHDVWATSLFAIAAGTDWIDGQVARRTNTVSKLGQVLDPAIDRILMISGVAGLLMVGRIPLWIVVLVVARDCLLLVGGAYLLKKYALRIPVIFLGKVTTTFLLFGFVGLLLNWPLVPGLSLIEALWLPGWSVGVVSWGIWFVYIGLVLSIATGGYYLYTAYQKLQVIKARSDGRST